ISSKAMAECGRTAECEDERSGTRKQRANVLVAPAGLVADAFKADTEVAVLDPLRRERQRRVHDQGRGRAETRQRVIVGGELEDPSIELLAGGRARPTHRGKDIVRTARGG